MESSIFLIQLLATVYLAIGIGALTSTKWYINMLDALKKAPHFMFMAGVLALVAGFAIISTHNIWNSDWTVIVTIVGWIAFLKGMSLLAFPTFGMNLAEKALKMKNIVQIVGGFSIIFGLILGYFGFFM